MRKSSFTSFALFMTVLGVSLTIGTVNHLAVSAAGIKSIKITNRPTEPVTVGSRLKLQTSISPSKAKKDKIVWSSSQEKVATISSKGTIHARKKGKTKITARSRDTGKKTSFRLTVKNPVKLKKLKITGNNEVQIGNTLQLSTVLTPRNATDTKISWKSSNKSIATVNDEGLVTARNTGKVTITAWDRHNKKKAKYKVKVLGIPVTGINFAASNITSLETGTSHALNVQIAPWNATNKKLKWSSSNKSAATVDENGIVTALRPIESVDITATSADNKNLSCTWNLKITITNGFITKSALDNLDLTVIDKVMFVAHPDDETLWGGAHLLEDEYLVVCMTHGWNERRRSAFTDTMRKTNDKYLILSYPDARKQFSDGSYETDTLSTCRSALQKDVEQVLSYKKWKQVITHNPNGEYGKYHHQQISRAVTEGYNKYCKNTSELWYFGRYYKPENIPGSQISPALLATKNQMVSRYYSTASGAIKAFGHMIPYENWLLVSDW